MNNLWPKHLLPTASGLSTARILTFGYNAHFMSRKEQASLNIGDFAKDLLFQMKYCESGPERIGQVPIIIVAHSMGGLVIKKAFVDGSQNGEYSDIISSIKAIFFLATPHRGTNLARTLNNILASSPFGHSPKDYVSQLASRSPAIDDLNESFRHHAYKLQTFSFYETLSTNVGPINSLLIVEKQSSILGYPDEVSQPMNANHHDVCKLKSADDPDYVTFVGALRSVVSTAQPLEETGHSLNEDLAQIAKYLDIAGAPDEDLVSARLRRKEGTCQGFLNCPEFHDWVTNRSSPPILWVHAPPGSGKSTLCGSVVDQLLDEKRDYAYFFFKYEDVRKRSVSYLFRSLAYQMATMIPAYRHELTRLANSGLRLHVSDIPGSWKRLFMSILSKIQLGGMVCWVIDGLDESESSKEVVDFISSVADFKGQVRVLFFSRPLPIISKSFQRARRKTPVTEMAIRSNENDIRLFVADEIDYLLSDDDFKSKIVGEVLKRSQNNFLWVSLVLERIVQCQRQEQVRQVLETTPDGMGRLFDRMLNMVEQVEAPEDKKLARSLLSWAMYAREPLTIKQLSESGAIKIETVMNLKHTVSQVCGQFVTIDAYNRVTLVHQSAREYLAKSKARPLSLDPELVHEELLSQCLAALSDEGLREKLKAHETPSFIPYAATSWGFHLENCSRQSEGVANTLIRFFRGPYPLQWIHYLSMSDHLSDMPLFSLQLGRWISEYSGSDTKQLSARLQPADLSFIADWSVDLMKLPVNFGAYLSQDPLAIYTRVPAFSPTESALYSYAENSNISLTFSDMSNRNWSNCVGRSLVSPDISRCFAVSSSYLAIPVDSPNNCITIWDTRNFQQMKKLYIDGYINRFNSEDIVCVTFNDSGSLFACTGVGRTEKLETWVWEVENWVMKYHGENPKDSEVIQLKFDKSDWLWMITMDGTIFKIPFDEGNQGTPIWTQLHPELLAPTKAPVSRRLLVKTSVAFNYNHTQIVTGSISSGLSVWDVASHRMISDHKPAGLSEIYEGDMCLITWHPSGSYLLGIYGRKLFKWNPTQKEYHEVNQPYSRSEFTDILCSPNGQVLITYTEDDEIQVYDTARLEIMDVLSMSLEQDSGTLLPRFQFSQDSLRIYSLWRSSLCAWEPECLRLMNPASGSGSPTAGHTIHKNLEQKIQDIHNSDSHNSQVIERQKRSLPTTLAVGSTCDQLVAYAKFGQMVIFDPVEGNQIQISVSSEPTCMTWSRNHDLLACLGENKICIFRISRDPTTRELSAEDIFKITLASAASGWGDEEMIFNETGELLFVYRPCDGSLVLKIPDGEIRATRVDQKYPYHCSWVHNYSRPDRLLQIRGRYFYVFTWHLQREESFSLSPTYAQALDGTAMEKQCELSLVFLRMYNWDYDLPFPLWDTRIILMTDIDSHKLDEHRTSAQEIVLPRNVIHAALYPLGILPDGRFVFLNSDNYVCTAHVQDPSGTITFHFFIPYELFGTYDDRVDARLLQDGTIVFPTWTQGVGVIKGGIPSTG